MSRSACFIKVRTRSCRRLVTTDKEDIMAQKIRPDEGRQGVTGQGVRYVLAFSLGGATIALIAILAIYVF